MTDEELKQRRYEMVRDDIRARGVTDPGVLTAMERVPREQFVPERERNSAYDNRPLPIGEGQTISQPYVVAVMLELLRLSGNERVLEIGTGSGYQTALLSYLAQEVFSMERLDTLAQRAQRILTTYPNVRLFVGDGWQGCPEHAPFERIIISAAPPSPPQALLEQLGHGGFLVAPIGHQPAQRLVRIRRVGSDYQEEEFGGVSFVPMV